MTMIVFKFVVKTITLLQYQNISSNNIKYRYIVIVLSKCIYIYIYIYTNSKSIETIIYQMYIFM